MVATFDREGYERKRGVKFMAEQNEMEKIVTPMVEDICDHLCRFPKEASDPEAMEEICAECQMEKYVCLILNTYNAASQLQASAEVVRSEFMQKGDWYKALEATICNYLYNVRTYATYRQMAAELTARIVGIEPEGESN